MPRKSVKGALIDQSKFRPHLFPKLELCIKFEDKPGESGEAAKRGIDLHELLAAVLAGELKIEDIKDKESRECIAWAVAEIDRRGITVHYVEYDVDITDADGNKITGGTADAWGVTTKELWVVDAKSGDEYDYSAQFAGYAKSILEEQRRDRCVFLLLYFDLRKAVEYDVEYADAADRVHQLMIRYRHREEEEPQANDYCGWCAKRGTCKVWLDSASSALTVSPSAEPDLVYKIAQIKKDPQKLAQFYIAFKRLAKLFSDEWHISDALLQHLKDGAKPEGVIMSHRKGDSHVNAEQALIECYHELGAMRFAQAISVNPTKLKEIWEKFTDRPFPLTILRGSDIYFPKIAQPKGRGTARKLRNNERRRQQHDSSRN
jgi:hypothetical protein